MFDVVGELHTLPDLVVANVFGHLPVSLVEVLTHSTSPEIRGLALSRMWELVAVGEGSEAGEPFAGCFHRVPHRVFHAMVRDGTPPPCRIGRLYYRTTLELLSDPLYVSPAWCEYVRTHSRSLTLWAVVEDESASIWRLVEPHLAEINLVDLLVIMFFDSSLVARSITGAAFPPSLRRLALDLMGVEGEDVRAMKVPQLVVHLEMHADGGIHPANLPRLPPHLRTLEFSVPEMVDVSEHVSAFPGSMERMELRTDVGFARISSAALQALDPLQHNMVVYLGDAMPEELHGLNAWPRNQASVDLAVPSDYSRVMLPQDQTLEVFQSNAEEPPEVRLLDINHWFPQLRQLELQLPLDLRGVEIPEDLEVVVRGSQGGVLPEVWNMRRVVLLDMGPALAGQVFPRLVGMPYLRVLDLRLDASALVEFPVLDNLVELKILLQGTNVFPCLTDQTLVERLTIEAESPAFEFDPARLPRHVVDMQLNFGGFAGLALALPREFAWQGVSLCHLTRLESLRFWGVKGVRLGAFAFPTTLLHLVCYHTPQLDLERVVFPPNLETLELTSCGLTDPWRTSSWLWPLWAGTTHVAYPTLLRRLNLSDNMGLVSPPRGFSFPPQLQELSMKCCGITDITEFRFPKTLSVLDVEGNDFPVPEAYAWPQLLLLRIGDPYGDSDLSEEERERLVRMIPGVRIND